MAGELTQRNAVTEWLRGLNVFVTGASGFIGKVLILKLLTACPEIGRIFVLLRPRKGKTSGARLDELLSSPIFQNVISKHPEAASKIQAMEGDISERDLGMKESDRAILRESVDLIFNAAASVRFDDTLHKALHTNARSVRDLTALAKQMKRLQAFVHVSTAFTNSNYRYLPERVLPLSFDWRKMIMASEIFAEHEMATFTGKILGSHPNTYIFTKKIAETIVYECRDEIPVVIYRPAVVSSASQEPEPGWCDSFNSILALSGAAGKGVLRVIFAKNSSRVDIITVDACVNGMIVAAWHRSQHGPESKDEAGNRFLYNATDCFFTIEWLINFGKALQFVHPISNMLWRGYCIACPDRFRFQLMTILLHAVPGFFLDKCLQLMNRKPIFGKIYRKLYCIGLDLSYFVHNTWVIENENFKSLDSLLTEREKAVFYTSSLHGHSSLQDLVFRSYLGMRKLLGDKEEVTKSAVDHAIRMYWLDMACRVLLMVLLLWTLPLKSAFNLILSQIRGLHALLASLA